MKAGLWQRLDQMARNLIPMCLILGLVLLSVVPTRLPYYAEVAPMLTVIGVGYWSVVRPDLIRAGVAFGIGVFEDVLTGAPLGFNALVLLCVQAAIVSQQRFFLGKSFLVWWWAFALIALAAALLKWVLFALIAGNAVHVGTVLFNYAITVLIYPAWRRLFASLEVTLAGEG